MPAKLKLNPTIETAAKRPIHITTRDKRLLEELISECKALRSEPASYLTALGEELKRAIVVDPEDVPADVITMNSRAEMLDLGTGETVTLTLVFPSQANIDQEKISVLAPIGAGMLGYRTGDEFTWQVPGGFRRMKVTKIHYQPEATVKSGA